MPHVQRSEPPPYSTVAPSRQPAPPLTRAQQATPHNGAPAALVRQPAQPVARAQHTPQLCPGVADSLVRRPRSHAPDEQRYRVECRKNVQKVAEAIQYGLTPVPLELKRMSLLLGYESERKADVASFAEDALTTLVRRKFNVHSDLGHVNAEMHVRLCYRAARKLTGAGVHKLSEAYQHMLIDQLLALSSFAQQQDNPNTLFTLSCLRNCIVSVGNDASMLRTTFQFGIAIAQIAAGAASQQAGSAASGVREAISLLSKAGMHAPRWYAKVQDIEKIDQKIEWAGCKDDHDGMVAGCNELLAFTREVLKAEVKRLKDFDSKTREKFKRAFNSLAIRQVDHEWDLAFACLDALHRNVWAYRTGNQMQELLNQITRVVRETDVPALRYKCIELTEELRQLPLIRPIGRVLLQLASRDAAPQALAVAQKRLVECDLDQSILDDAYAELQEEQKHLSGFAAPLQLNRSGSLRLQAPRYGAALTVAAAAPAGLGQPPSILSSLRSAGSQLSLLRPQPHRQTPAAAASTTAQAAAEAAKAANEARALDDAAAEASVDGLRLGLYANEGLSLLCEALARRRAGELAAMVRANVRVSPERELTAAEVRLALPHTVVGGPQPKRLLGLAVVVGDADCVRALCASKPCRGFVTDAAVREAQILAAHGRVPGMAQTLAQALAASRSPLPRS